MSKIIIHPTYFPDILSFSKMIFVNKILFEINDFYEKQTYRNRMYIQSANRKQMLTVPVIHTHTDGKQIYKDVLISYDFDWQRNHWRSIETAYRSSPYFEYYEDDLLPLFNRKEKYLVDFNIKIIEKLSEIIEVNLSHETTDSYLKKYREAKDYRYLKDAKKKYDFQDKLPEYTQVFQERFDFMPNLSILDLLFMEGPNSYTYLEQVNNKVKL